MPDTLNTIRQLEHARLIYDAYRNELDRMESKANKSASPSTTTQQGAGDETSTVASEGSTDISHNPPSNPAPQQEVSIQQLRQKFSKSREDYLALKSVTDVKMKLLHENRVCWVVLGGGLKSLFGLVNLPFTLVECFNVALLYYKYY